MWKNRLGRFISNMLSIHSMVLECCDRTRSMEILFSSLNVFKSLNAHSLIGLPHANCRCKLVWTRTASFTEACLKCRSGDCAEQPDPLKEAKIRLRNATSCPLTCRDSQRYRASTAKLSIGYHQCESRTHLSRERGLSFHVATSCMAFSVY